MTIEQALLIVGDCVARRKIWSDKQEHPPIDEAWEVLNDYMKFFLEDNE